MSFSLDKVVPWGRSFEEYVAMFDLSDKDLACRVLGCGDGPAGFNAELARRGGRVVSIDPIYAFSRTQIRQRISETYETVMAQMRSNRADYLWTSISSVDELGGIRMSAMDAFLADYETGQAESRYVAGELPYLPFADNAFDIALSSHCLFLYSDHFSENFHIQSLLEMLRVAREIRVFPLLGLDGKPSLHLGGVVADLHEHGFQTDISLVPYEFQRGANQMLRVVPA
ncbi:SAM-dependent methyltransferase [Halomicronema sp. CCY15110]|uniref:SAM-dependent methyltransferase n=1 Tax=Halomicronema sp. CCY15110 TaxID=2767773 RepID=UPI00194E3B15|nr:SAM-dependent methyltransferase [Halomicronema sp. CCY15110]